MDSNQSTNPQSPETCDLHWKSSVESRLDTLESTLVEFRTDLKNIVKVVDECSMEDVRFRTGLMKELEANAERSFQQREDIKKLIESSNGGKYVSFEWVREKYMTPIVVAGIGFVLFSLMPTILGFVALLAFLVPKLLEVL